MKANGTTPKEGRFVFKAAHFYELLDRLQYRCPYSGRTLTPQNTVAEHRQPLRKQGQHKADNITLVDFEVAYLKRYLTDEETLQLAVDIVNTLGKQHGLRIAKKKIRSTPR